MTIKVSTDIDLKWSPMSKKKPLPHSPYFPQSLRNHVKEIRIFLSEDNKMDFKSLLPRK